MASDIEGGERFVLEPQWERPEFGEDYDGLCVVDTLTDAVVGADGGEPEDQTLGRDWRWVVAALNSVNAERDAALAEGGRLRAELVEWRDSLASWPDYWTVEVSEIRYRIDAILSGGES